MSLKDFKETSSRWNCFKKTDTLGRFDFCTNIVSLESLHPQNVHNISVDQMCVDPIEFETYQRYSKAFPLIAHEYTHFLDSTATVWGFNRLTLMESAYTCPLDNEHKFKVIKEFYDYCRRIKLPDYYTTYDKSVNAERPWKYFVTCGVEFTNIGTPSKRPIAFVRFFNADDEAITRTPISMVSLLENTAMAEELEVKAALVERLMGEKSIEAYVLQKELMDYIYNPELTEYSVCAHLLANRQDCKDARVAFHCSGIISRLTLNATPMVFTTVRRNLDPYLRRYGIPKDSPPHRNIKAALKEENHGILYYLIAMQLPDGCLDTLQTFVFGLASSLRVLGIPVDTYMHHARDSVKQSADKLKNSRSEYFKVLAESGLDNFEKLSKLGSPLVFSDFSLPPAILGDLSHYQFNPAEGNRLKDIDLEDMYSEMVKGQVRFEQFGMACF